MKTKSLLPHMCKAKFHIQQSKIWAPPHKMILRTKRTRRTRASRSSGWQSLANGQSICSFLCFGYHFCFPPCQQDLKVLRKTSHGLITLHLWKHFLLNSVSGLLQGETHICNGGKTKTFIPGAKIITKSEKCIPSPMFGKL